MNFEKNAQIFFSWLNRALKNLTKYQGQILKRNINWDKNYQFKVLLIFTSLKYLVKKTVNFMLTWIQNEEPGTKDLP